MSPAQLSRLIKQQARALGFERCGVTAAGPVARADYLEAWLAAGRHGTMQYLEKYLEQRTDPRRLLPGARSVIVVALNYRREPPPATDDEPRGRIAMYAWGSDYHKVMKRKLHALADALREKLPAPEGQDGQHGVAFRACVDTAPLLEREMAAAAGVAWIGKNTMAIDPELGSYFFLGELITTLDLPPDEPMPDHCGTCTACLEACPTDAFPAAYEMDASRCISYLTIEHREEIPSAFHEAMGDWVFGCDICQEVCPHNRSAPRTREPRFAVQPPGPAPSLDDLQNWTDEEYREALRGSAIKRARPAMLRRNARIAAQNAASDQHQ